MVTIPGSSLIQSRALSLREQLDTGQDDSRYLRGHERVEVYYSAADL